MTFVILLLLAVLAAAVEARSLGRPPASGAPGLPRRGFLLPSFKGAAEVLSRNHELRRLLFNPATPDIFQEIVGFAEGPTQVAVDPGQSFIPAPIQSPIAIPKPIGGGGGFGGPVLF